MMIFPSDSQPCFVSAAIYDTSITLHPTYSFVRMSGDRVYCRVWTPTLLFFILWGIHIEWMKEIKGEGEEGGKKREKNHHWGSDTLGFCNFNAHPSGGRQR
jgi:hypothetical protein